MSRIYLVVVLSLIGAVCNGQRDKIRIPDNGYLKGRVLEGNTDALLFLINESDTFQIAWPTLLSVKIHKKEHLQPLVLAKIDSINKLSNNQIHIGFDFGGQFDDSDGNNIFRASTSVLPYFRWRQYLQFGLGVGLSQYSTFDAVPFFIQYQGDFSHNHERGVFYYMAIGKSLAWSKSSCDCNYDDIDGGRMLKAGLGYKWHIETLNISLTMGWVQQRMEADIDHGIEFLSIVGGNNRTTIKQSLNGFEIKLGVTL